MRSTRRAARPRRLPRVLSPGEARLLLAATAGNSGHQTMIALGLYAGLRASEIVNLKVGDIDMEQALLRVQQGKGGADATLSLNPRLTPYLRPFLERLRHLPLVHGRYPERPYSSRQLQTIVTEAAARAGLPGHVHVHTLRHTFGTEFHRRSGDLGKTQRAMRHADPSTTMIYVHLTVEDMRAVADELDFEPERLQAAVDTLDSAGP